MIRISPDFYTEFRIFYGFYNFLIFFNIFYRPSSSETASSDKKYMELNGAGWM